MNVINQWGTPQKWVRGGNQIFKVQWGEAKERERGNTIFDLNLVGQNLEGNYY